MRDSGDRWDRGFITFHAYVYAHMYAKCFLKSSVLSVSSVSLYFCPRIVPLESALHHIFIGINDLL